MKKIKINYILIIIGLIGGLFSGFNFKGKQQEKLHIQFHYKGNIARTVDLPKYDYGYIEHQSVKQLKYLFLSSTYSFSPYLKDI